MCREKLPVWQKLFEKYGSENFTVVGLALDAEGIAPAKLYYEKYGVKFPSLVDPNYATQFGAVPKTFFVNEHGVVLSLRNWERHLPKADEVLSVSDEVRQQWSESNARFDAETMAGLVEANSKSPADLSVAAQLGSRYLALGLRAEAEVILKRAVADYQPKLIARRGGQDSRELGQVYLQLMRCYTDDRKQQVEYATLSYYLNPSIGFAKQIARLIDPDRFDKTKSGRLDNTFREATYQRLKRERAAWLSAD